jgi:hypothetical protein
MNERAYSDLLDQLGSAMAAEAAANFRGFSAADHAGVGVQVGIDLGVLFALRHPELAERFRASRLDRFATVDTDPAAIEAEQLRAVQVLRHAVGGDA